MALSFSEKETIVAEVAEVANSAYSVVVAEYAGLESNEMNALRDKAREGGVYLRVVKNSLARRAVEGTDYACLQETARYTCRPAGYGIFPGRSRLCGSRTQGILQGQR